jgi:hypothetical protein
MARIRAQLWHRARTGRMSAEPSTGLNAKVDAREERGVDLTSVIDDRPSCAKKPERCPETSGLNPGLAHLMRRPIALRRRRVRGRRAKRLDLELGLAATVPVVDVAHRGLDVRVTHRGLDRRHLGPADRERAERVAEIVEAQLAQFCPLQRRPIPDPDRGRVLEATELAGEDKVLRFGEVSRPDLLLDLSPIGRPALRVPNRTAPAFDPEQSGK